MTNAENEEGARRYYLAFSTRARRKTLNSSAKRAVCGARSRAYGLPSYAHFVTRRRMVRNPETVQRFLDEVKAKVREIERKEITELRAFKAERR
jgi:thimet oligopeptidase